MTQGLLKPQADSTQHPFLLLVIATAAADPLRRWLHSAPEEALWVAEGKFTPSIGKN
jgi:hypothetical protein